MYQLSYDSVCDFLKGLSSLSIETDSEVLLDTKNTFGHWTKESINMFFKNIKGWDIIKMFNKDIPGSNCICEETIHVSI